MSIVAPDAAIPAPSAITRAGAARTQAAEPIDGDEIALERTGFDTYALVRGGTAVGFVDVVGRIHVVYLGSRSDRAVEIAQVLDLADAVRRLTEAL